MHYQAAATDGFARQKATITKPKQTAQYRCTCNLLYNRLTLGWLNIKIGWPIGNETRHVTISNTWWDLDTLVKWASHCQQVLWIIECCTPCGLQSAFCKLMHATNYADSNPGTMCTCLIPKHWSIHQVHAFFLPILLFSTQFSGLLCLLNGMCNSGSAYVELLTFDILCSAVCWCNNTCNSCTLQSCVAVHGLPCISICLSALMS